MSFTFQMSTSFLIYFFDDTISRSIKIAAYTTNDTVGSFWKNDWKVWISFHDKRQFLMHDILAPRVIFDKHKLSTVWWQGYQKAKEFH